MESSPIPPIPQFGTMILNTSTDPRSLTGIKLYQIRIGTVLVPTGGLVIGTSVLDSDNPV